MNIYGMWRWYWEQGSTEELLASCWERWECPEDLEGEITQAFQRFVISDAKTQQTGSPKIKIDLCRGNHRPRT